MANKALSSRSFKIDTRLYLTEHSVETKKTKKVLKPEPVNHVYCCDISGSMYDTLPKMRKQLKNRLSSTIADLDTITIIAFAGKHECFVLKEMAKCNTPTELKMLQDAIDKFLVPMGCTDFVNPVVETKKLFDNNKNCGLWNWVFLSDGGHNESSFTNVINALKEIKDSVGNASIIEYGYWADSDRLTEMAETLGGTKVVASDFDSYVPVFERALSTRMMTKAVVVPLTKEIADNRKIEQMFYLDQNSKTIHVIMPDEKHKDYYSCVHIPESVTKFYSISSKVVGDNAGEDFSKLDEGLSPLYAAANVCADRLQYGLVEKLLAAIGDTKFIGLYATAFGKVRLFNFQTEIATAVFEEGARGTIDPNYEAPSNAYCVVDLIDDLKSGNNFVLCCNSRFNYNRTTAKTTDKVELTAEEQELLKNAKTAAQVEKITKAAEERKVKMTMIDKGYPINGFTWNEERANLSARLLIDVELELPQNEFKITKVNSTVWRNFTLIKDGIVNVQILPVILDKKTFEKLSKTAVKIDVIKKHKGDMIECDIDMSSVPVLNRNKVFTSKAAKMTKLSLALLEYQFQLKYLGYLKKQLGIKEEELVEGKKYSEKEKEYLATLGITAKGYNPAKETVKSEDFYNYTAFTAAFKNFSSIPKIEDVEKYLKEKKKLTPSMEFLKNVMVYIDGKYLSGVKGDAYKDAVVGAFNGLSVKKLAVAEELAKMKFAMIVSHKWFMDRTSFDDNADSIDSSFGGKMEITYNFVEKRQNL